MIGQFSRNNNVTEKFEVNPTPIINFRWLGPKRYEISGAKTWLNNKGYEGRITFTLDHNNSTNPTNLENRCLHRCPTCEEVTEVLDGKNENSSNNLDKDKETNDNKEDNTNTTQTIEGEFMSITGAVMSCMSPKSPKGLTPSAHLGDGNLDLIIVNKTSRVNYLRYLIHIISTIKILEFIFPKLI